MCHIANRALTDVETRYGQTELEATAIKFACAHSFYKYLVGAPRFEIITDCKPLVHPFNNPTSRGPLRIERQVLAITRFRLRGKVSEGSGEHRRLWIKTHSEERERHPHGESRK